MFGSIYLPLGFWASLAVAAGLSAYSWEHRKEGWGFPSMAVCATVVFWYHIDLIYNGGEEFSRSFSAEIFAAAWWQVTLFLLSFWALVPAVHRIINRRLLSRRSTVVSLLAGQLTLDQLQPLLAQMNSGFAVIWAGITVAALLRTGFDWQGVFFPWLGHEAQAWGRARIGGTYDFLISIVQHVNLFALSGFGIVAALAKSAGLRNAALILMALAWPTVLLDRTRHTMLVLMLPGLTALVFVRLRKHRAAQVAVLAVALVAISVWFSFVLAARGTQSVAAAFATGSVLAKAETKHAGLNMMEELCWINKFIDEGKCPPNWGQRYFAEAVNFVPAPCGRTNRRLDLTMP